jgi:hypothetical protein
MLSSSISGSTLQLDGNASILVVFEKLETDVLPSSLWISDIFTSCPSKLKLTLELAGLLVLEKLCVVLKHSEATDNAEVTGF